MTPKTSKLEGALVKALRKRATGALHLSHDKGAFSLFFYAGKPIGIKSEHVVVDMSREEVAGVAMALIDQAMRAGDVEWEFEHNARPTKRVPLPIGAMLCSSMADARSAHLMEKAIAQLMCGNFRVTGSLSDLGLDPDLLAHLNDCHETTRACLDSAPGRVEVALAALCVASRLGMVEPGPVGAPVRSAPSSASDPTRAPSRGPRIELKGDPTCLRLDRPFDSYLRGMDGPVYVVDLLKNAPVSAEEAKGAVWLGLKLGVFEYR